MAIGRLNTHLIPHTAGVIGDAVPGVGDAAAGVAEIANAAQL